MSKVHVTMEFDIDLYDADDRGTVDQWIVNHIEDVFYSSHNCDDIFEKLGIKWHIDERDELQKRLNIAYSISEAKETEIVELRKRIVELERELGEYLVK